MRKRLFISFAVFVGYFLGSSCLAFDAQPPPDPVTVEWTQEFLSATKRKFLFEKTTVGQVLEFAESSMGFPGFYIDFDFEQVKERLDHPLEIKLEKGTWLQVLGRVADTIEADLIVGRGIVRFVPRDPRKGSWEKRFENEKKSSPKQPSPIEDDPFGRADAEGGDAQSTTVVNSKAQ